ncbi:MAG TPA: iron ABC transporter permease [Acidimicrobiia bacterium]|nr:iron ABC transporter permease [Acidimicrobiia bacterium]
MAAPADLEDVVAAPRRVSPTVLIGGLVVALVGGCVVAAAVGAFSIPITDILGSIAHRVGLPFGPQPDPTAESVLWDIRFPRIALAVVVGAALGCAGASMQGTFGNPLAEPGIVGVSSGAALGAVAGIALGFAALGTWSLTAVAFVGGLVTVAVVYAASRSDGRTEVVTLILTGIAVNAFTGAVIGLLTFFADDAELRSITFWSLGSVAQATWPKVAVVAPVAVAGIVLATRRARSLDLLALGDRAAVHVGVDVDRLRLAMLTIVAVLTASAVAVSGIILFVGLVVPHLVRMVAGPGHRLLLPASALGGAALLVVADLIARTIAAPAEVPLGVLTALIGSPFFFWLLRRTRARQGGWA